MHVGGTKWQAELAVLEPWGAEHVKPAINALMAQDYTLAAQLLDAAQAELEASAFPAEILESIQYALRLQYLRLGWLREPASLNRESFEAAMDYFGQPAASAFAARACLICRFHVRLMAENSGLEPLSHEVVEEMLNAMEGDPELNQLLHHAAAWAYRNRDLKLLERAYCELLVNPHSVLGSAKWLRVNLMYLLVSGKAVRRDIEESIKALKIKPQLDEFMARLWPDCLATGLVDDELRELLWVRTGEIEAAQPAELREKKTKAMRTVGL
jgi:hypothetical protein